MRPSDPGSLKQVIAVMVLSSALACATTPLSLDSTALLVTTDAEPSLVSVSAPEPGIVTVTVRVTNPEDRDVVVHVGGPPWKTGKIPAAETQGAGFGMQILAVEPPSNGGPAVWTWGQPDFSFGPRQTLSHTFIVNLHDEGSALAPGSYRIVGSFGHKEAAPVTLTVRP